MPADEDRIRQEVRREVVEQLTSILNGIGGERKHVILLNDYQVVNLLSVLWASGYASVYGNNPLSVINNGDWTGELWNMLPKLLPARPNAEPEELAARARAWCSSHAPPSHPKGCTCGV